MNTSTHDLFEQLKSSVWFSNAGCSHGENAITLGTWDIAIQSRRSPEFQDLRLTASNALRRAIQSVSLDRYQKWNDHIDDLKPLTMPLVRRKINDLMIQNHFSNEFEGAVQWDILHACLESEYSDIVPLGFYSNLAQWYLKGHFPCGWQGGYPDGKLIVY